MLLTLLLGCIRHPLQATPEGARISLPGDHAPHDTAQTEWWHVHAHLRDQQTDEPLHLFVGFVTQRTDLDRVALLPVSPFVNPFHVAYVQVVTDEQTWTSDRANFPDRFAARFVGDGLDLRHGGWRIAWEADTAVLRVSAGPHTLDLRLNQGQPASLPGEDGRVEMGSGAHQWMQIERMETRGRWQDGRKTRWVEGVGFYKHQWGRMYDPDLDGFEWISMDLPDGGLSIGWLRDDGMRGVPGSVAFFSTMDGQTIALPGDLRIEPTRHWRSPQTGARWPVAWHITGEQIDLEVSALLENQELRAFPAPLFVGPAHATGEVLDQPIDQIAFIEQTGARVPRLRGLLSSRSPQELP